jgi:hypothetical protein
MPVQTSKASIYLSDGCKVSLMKPTDSTFFDIGLIQGDYTALLQYDEESIEFGNGKTRKSKRNFRVEGGFTLATIEGEGLEKMSNGVITRIATPGTQVLSAAFDTQVIDGFTANVPVELLAVVTATGVPIKFSAAPVITSIVDDENVPNTLIANDDYFVVPDGNSASGYSIMFTNAGTGSIALTAELTITFGNNTPISSETLYAGTSSMTATAYAMRIQHFTSAGVVDRQLDLYSAYTSPGSYNFGFKGADTGGIDTMDITFSAELDDTKVDGRQLLAFTRTV